MKLINSLVTMVKRNQTTLLSSSAIVGVGTTAYLTGRATVKAVRIVDLEEGRGGTAGDAKQRLKERVHFVWKLYVPAAASGVLTSACIIGVAKVGNKRAMAAQAAFVVTERAYSEYRDKVIEEYGEKKDEKIRDAIAQDRVNQTAPKQEVYIAGSGTVLCCESYTGRYFMSDIETLRKQMNELNANLLRHDQISMETWYYMIGLEPTAYSSDIGWSSDRLMELQFTSTLTPDGRPCLVFTYNYHRPLYDGLYR